MKIENLGTAALFATAVLISPAPALAGGDEAEYEAEADVRVCVVSIRDAYGRTVSPYGNPTDPSAEFLSIEGNYDAQYLYDPLLVQSSSGKAKTKAKARSDVYSGGLKQSYDVNGFKLGEFDSLANHSGAAFGMNSTSRWRYRYDEWDDDDDRRKGDRRACRGDNGIRVSAKVEGEVPTKRSYGSAQSIADSFPRAYLYVKNNTFKDLKLILAMEFSYCGEVERAYGTTVSALISISVNRQDDFGQPFGLIEANSSYKDKFCRKGTRYATLEVPSFGFPTFEILANANGSALKDW